MQRGKIKFKGGKGALGLRPVWNISYRSGKKNGESQEMGRGERVKREE